MATSRLRPSHRNCCKSGTLIKLPQLCLSLIILLFCRLGLRFADDDFDRKAEQVADTLGVSMSDYVPWGDPNSVNSNIFGDFVVFGFFTVILAQFVAYLAGEKPYFQNALLNVTGGICYGCLGVVHIMYYKDRKRTTERVVGESYYAVQVTNGALAIVLGAVMLVDAVLCVFKMDEDEFA